MPHLIVCSSVREVRVGAWNQGLIKEPWKSAACWLAPSNLLSLLAYSMKDHHCTRKCTTDLPTGQSGGGIFSIEVPSSKMTLIFVKLTLKTSQHSWSLLTGRNPVPWRTRDQVVSLSE